MEQKSASPILRIVDVSHVFGSGTQAVQALSEINLDVYPGEFISLVGPSGCGKSTLLRAIAGLMVVETGRIFFHGDQVSAPNPKATGVVFQEARLFPWKRVIENVCFPLLIQQRHRITPEMRERASKYLELVGLENFADHYPHQLSGGMKQRVSIARGLIQNPEILLMDEPFGALDEFTRADMGDELLRIWQETGVTVVFVTHSIEEAIKLSDRVAVMTPRPGRIVDLVDIDLSRPRSEEVDLTAPFIKIKRRIVDQFQAHGSGSR